MSRLLVVLVLLLATSIASAGKQTFDLVQFDPPAPYKKIPWVKEGAKNSNQNYTVIDKAAGTYCRIAIYKSVESKGDDLDAEFRSEWAELTKSYGVPTAQVTDPREEGGWKIVAGVAAFPFDGKTSFVMLTTFTGYGRTTSIVAVTSSEDFFPVIERFLASLRMTKPPGTKATAPANTTTPAKTTPATKGGQQHAEQYMEYNTMLKTWVWKWRYPKSK
jgi:hypothetical protein